MRSDMLSRYLKTHFVDQETFLRSSNITAPFFRSLIATSAMPGAIYRIWDNDTVWSPIGGWIGSETVEPPRSEWFSPAAIWWARRAAVLANDGQKPGVIASWLRDMFLTQFITALASEPLARQAYPDAFGAEGSAQAAGLSEWDDWINGGYGVCLRRFDAPSLIAKAGQAARVKEITNSGRRTELTTQDKLDLIDALEQLDAVMLPFAPYQRPKGTPGFWVDAPLARYGLGSIPLVESIVIDDDAALCA